MALQIAYTDPTGANPTAAYVRVRAGGLNLQDKRAQADVFVYNSAGDRARGALHQLSYSVEDADFDTWFGEAVLKGNGTSLMTRWYAYLKAQSLFSGAADV